MLGREMPTPSPARRAWKKDRRDRCGMHEPILRATKQRRHEIGKTCRQMAGAGKAVYNNSILPQFVREAPSAHLLEIFYIGLMLLSKNKRDGSHLPEQKRSTGARNL